MTATITQSLSKPANSKKAHWSKVRVAGREYTDFQILCSFSTRQLEACAEQQKAADGFYAPENLEMLREAWKVARAREASASVAQVVAPAPVVAVAHARRCDECGRVGSHRADCALL